MSSSTETPVAEPAQTPRRNPFARLRQLDLYWLLLKPVFKGRQLVHPERLARVTVSHERVALLELYRLEVRLEGEPALERGNRLEVMVDHRNQRVRFGPAEDFLISPAGRGLAGYLLSELIDWLQLNCSHFMVTPIPLVDAELPESTRRARDRVLQRAGFELYYADPASGVGRAQVGQVSGLIAGWNTERVARCDVSALLADLREQENLVIKNQAQLNSLRAKLENYQRSDAGNRFAIGCLLVFSLFQALLLFWVVMR